jgi:protein-S-isoprenylcysteine O-methyltransferase Ste14
MWLNRVVVMIMESFDRKTEEQFIEQEYGDDYDDFEIDPPWMFRATVVSGVLLGVVLMFIGLYNVVRSAFQYLGW